MIYFCRKVLGIVAFQLLCTFVVILGAAWAGPENPYALFLAGSSSQLTSFFVFLFVFTILWFGDELRRQVPYNYILLFIMTAALSFMIASLTVWLTFESVLLTVGVLCASLVFIFLSALFTPNKEKAITYVIIGLLVCLCVQITLVDQCWVWGFCGSGWYIAYTSLGVIVCFGLIYLDVFLIMAAGRMAQDEYILASLKLYVDIALVLILLLGIFGKRK